MKQEYICDKAGICGIADNCFHGKPHTPIKCGCCSTFCAQSLWCQGGTACGVGKMEDNPEQKIPTKELVPMRCVEVKEAL